MKGRVKDGINAGRTRAVLATDFIGSKSWVVEIKVISGFDSPPQTYDLTAMTPTAEVGIQT